MADGVAAGLWTPGAGGVHGDLGVEAEGAVLVHQLLVRQTLHLGLAQHTLHSGEEGHSTAQSQFFNKRNVLKMP